MKGRCARGTTVQSIIFPANKYSVAQATAWLRAHGKKSAKVDRRGGQLRFRQIPPTWCETFGTIKLGASTGIKAVVCCPKKR